MHVVPCLTSPPEVVSEYTGLGIQKSSCAVEILFFANLFLLLYINTLTINTTSILTTININTVLITAAISVVVLLSPVLLCIVGPLLAVVDMIGSVFEGTSGAVLVVLSDTIVRSVVFVIVFLIVLNCVFGTFEFVDSVW